ncbi:hypothetical protein AMATHDRAFT_68639 [Amanita thiersii Skay4041]|uniref:Uncharacterized protein n=1 Tax=Amanita thiersii Skay4041 TaxID=703135 RepID=A0A2A9N8C5_9AGAR|nr:hypothetical protein AMATHDRAFT_68639 [Amanita thiersii Skay4041]
MSFPVELIYEVICTLWGSNLSPDDRIHFMTSMKRVSRIWSAVFEDVSSSIVHIPCRSFYQQYFASVTRLFSACKTITFTVAPDGHHCPHLSYMRPKDIAKLTSLETMNVIYYNMGFPDPYTQEFFLALPHFLSKLSISYTFSPDIPPAYIKAMRRQFKRESKVRYVTPQVGTLEVSGADEWITAIWESLFPERQRLIMNGKELREPLMRVSNTLDLTLGLLLKLRLYQQEKVAPHVEKCESPLTSGSERLSHASTLVANDGEKGATTPRDISRTATTSSIASSSSDAKGRSREAAAVIPRMQVVQVEADGIRFLSTNALIGDLPSTLVASTSASLGDLGYFNKSAGRFVPLFNVLEPHDVEGYCIPSLHGYGEVQVRHIKQQQQRYQNQQATVLPVQGRLRDISAEEEEGDVDRELAGQRCTKEVIKSLLKAVTRVGQRSGRGKKGELRCLGVKGTAAAEMWFSANIDCVLRVYEHSLNLNKEDLLLVTGVVVR